MYMVIEKQFPIVGLFILRDDVIAERYLTMLREEFWTVIITWENIEVLIFVQDGTPPRLAIAVREWLNAHFPGRWMGCDIKPCNFFLGGLVEGASLHYQTNDYGRT